MQGFVVVRIRAGVEQHLRQQRVVVLAGGAVERGLCRSMIYPHLQSTRYCNGP